MEGFSPITDLARDECLDRLSSAPLARILVSVRCLPTALPARIRLLNREKVVIDTSDPVVVGAARRGDVLTVQVDGLDEHDHAWSVVVSGFAEISADTGEFGELTSPGGQFVSFPLSVVLGQLH
ncbi:MAG TPA: pyridoxamine 5'-phosphate oxidase family protein [Acidimicrobiales bacterium]